MNFLRYVFRDQKIVRLNPQLTLGELYHVKANDLGCVPEWQKNQARKMTSLMFYFPPLQAQEKPENFEH